MGEGESQKLTTYPCKYADKGCKDTTKKKASACTKCKARDQAVENRKKYKHYK